MYVVTLLHSSCYIVVVTSVADVSQIGMIVTVLRIDEVRDVVTAYFLPRVS